MVFRLCESANDWRRLSGSARLAEVVAGVRFVSGKGPYPGRCLMPAVHNIDDSSFCRWNRQLRQLPGILSGG